MNTGTLDSASSPPPAIVPGATAQPGADWTINLTSGGANTTINTGEVFIFTVGDQNTPGTPNCTVTDEWVGFNDASTITATDESGSTTPVTFAVDTTSSSPQCAGLGGGPIRDVVRIRATSSGAVSTIGISGVQYDTGSAVAPGLLKVTDTGTTAVATLPIVNGLSSPNAYVTRAKVTTAPVTLSTDLADQAIGDISIAETVPGIFPTGSFVCIALIGPPNATFNETTAPTTTVSAGNVAVADAGFLSTTQVEFKVNTASTTASTVTISGLALDTGAAELVSVIVGVGSASGDGCSSGTADELYSIQSPIASVGTTTRIAGVDRNGTARQVSNNLGACQDVANVATHTHNFAIIARNDDFADALAAGYLAGFHDQVGAGGAVVRTPILLTATDGLPTDTVAALHDRAIDQIIIIGGTSAVSTDVQSALAGLPVFSCNGTNRSGGVTGAAMAVSRIAGETRYDTARLIAQTVGQAQAVGTLAAGGLAPVAPAVPVNTAILASGENFPDAVAAAPMSIFGDQVNGNGFGFPLLLTQAATIPPETTAAMSALGIKQVIIAGGTAAVSADVETALTDAHIGVVRLSGDDRSGTAAAIGGFELGAGSATVAGLGWVPTSPTMLLANGAAFPDALAGAPLAAMMQTPILLTAGPDLLGDATAAFLAGTTGITQMIALGGPAAVSDDTLQAAVTALFS
jgi:putative cell wall-binding protein